MAVYREGYHAVETYSKLESQIWNDSCDMGVVVIQGDKNWNLFKQLVNWYKVNGTRRVLSTGEVSVEVELIDEWAVSDERKTVEQATERFTVNYFKFERQEQSLIQGGFDGFFNINRVNR